MSTANYSLPTISGEEVIDIVGDMNALANATDAALKKVEQGGLDPYMLPTATRTVKGGVIVGDGLSITPGGVLSTVSQGGGGGSATLPVATSVTLGGVKIGAAGVVLTADNSTLHAEIGGPLQRVVDDKHPREEAVLAAHRGGALTGVRMRLAERILSLTPIHRLCLHGRRCAGTRIHTIQPPRVFLAWRRLEFL